MKSIAAYYVLIAMNGQEQLDPDRARAERIAAATPRPSLVARVLRALGSPRAARSAAGAA
jgi:hypothetical protein